MISFNYKLDYTRIKNLRIQHNLSQKNMAKILNISRATYTQFESMKRELFSITKVNEFANYFNVSLDYLLNLCDKKERKILKKSLDSSIAGKRLKEVRHENKYYQDTLASEIGVTSALISEYEKGKRLISLSFSFYVCKKFNISMDWLYGKTNYPKYLTHN